MKTQKSCSGYEKNILGDDKMKTITVEKTIRLLVSTAVETYATTFSARHLRELDDPDGTLNMKIHNVFIAMLGEEIQY